MTIISRSQEKIRKTQGNFKSFGSFLESTTSQIATKISRKQKPRKRSTQVKNEFAILPENPNPFVLRSFLSKRKHAFARRLLNEYLNNYKNFDSVYAAQTYYASRLGCSVDTISNWTRMLTQMGLMDYGQQFFKGRRGKKVFGSNIIVMSGWFKRWDVRNTLAPILSALCFFSINFYPSVTNSKLAPVLSNSQTSVQLKEDINIYIKDKSKTTKRGYEVKRFIDTLNYLKEDSKKKLRIFPDEALNFADKCFRNAERSKINDSFTFFYKLCEHYCTVNNIAFEVPTTKLEDKMLKAEPGAPKNGFVPTQPKAPVYNPRIPVEGITCHQMSAAELAAEKMKIWKKRNSIERTPEQVRAQNEFLSILGMAPRE